MTIHSASCTCSRCTPRHGPHCSCRGCQRARRGKASVRQLQASLNTLMRTHRPLAVDGAYGPRTRAAVRAFQRWVGLVPDGVAGPQTLRALRRFTRTR
ncbi:MAG: peptidoglycan-binding domain-containing protein [Pseudomonadota bacterium]